MEWQLPLQIGLVVSTPPLSPGLYLLHSFTITTWPLKVFESEVLHYEIQELDDSKNWRHGNNYEGKLSIRNHSVHFHKKATNFWYIAMGMKLVCIIRYLWRYWHHSHSVSLTEDLRKLCLCVYVFTPYSLWTHSTSLFSLIFPQL